MGNILDRWYHQPADVDRVVYLSSLSKGVLGKYFFRLILTQKDTEKFPSFMLVWLKLVYNSELSKKWRILMGRKSGEINSTTVKTLQRMVA